MSTQEMYEFLLDREIVTEDTLNVVLCINGDNEETYESILYVVTGYNSFETYIESEE